jgi:DNA replication and repair protein RecF
VRVTRVRVRGFRNLRAQELELGSGITLLWGPNGAGKTNLMEAVFMGLAGRSCRTRSDRETVAFDQPLARVEVDVAQGTDESTFLWSLARGGERRHLLDGTAVTGSLTDRRPPLAVFLPDRLALVKGAPSERRGHIDRLVVALWPSRAETRRLYGRALAQRNALLGRVRAGMAPPDSLEAWDLELASAGSRLMDARRDAISALAAEFARAAAELGLAGGAELRYAPRSPATSADELVAELRDRRAGDVERGYSAHGPHLDDVAIAVGGRSVRRYGSQGEQRTSLLSLLFAERRALLEARRTPPLMLLDDVMSELDPDRREHLASRLAEGGGQTLITATEPEQLPPGWNHTQIAVRDGEAEPDGAAAHAERPGRAAFAA